ncbi:hypothetical protein GSI_01771 [Ganoderma sinense ZZ0214-1]|uniref:F-box domain-containing protein n=1 Tax=Ganoderma sinense ZZ0214-1 TaxID=1077348 RepID=A0A2G8SQR1_9APHY|nr:hypothetical protein GSI_01771 [Ganoderma sinense ZZ0214-1]
MDCLPEELISYVFDFLHPGGALSSAMLVNQRWYMYGARNLHHTIVFCLGPGLTINSPDVAISFMKRLISSPLSTAHLVHHLTLSGFASLDIQQLILDILGRMHNLRSLNMHSLHILQGGIQFPPKLVTSPSFLPNLVALNASSAPFGVSLAHTRQYVQALRVHEPMDDACLRRLLSPGSGSGGSASPCPAHKIKLLELALSVDSTAAAVARVAFLASTLAGGALRALALRFDFDVDRPRPVSWDEFEGLINELGPHLQPLQSLRTLSIVTRPDPPIVAAAVDGQQGGELFRKAVTRQLAERLLAGSSLPSLEAIELRWHGWRVQGAQMVEVPGMQLMRGPHRWLFETSGSDMAQ